MATLSAILLCLATSSERPATAAELQLAVAGLEQQLTRIESLEVVYRTHTERPRGAKLYPGSLADDSSTATWIRKGAKQSFTVVYMEAKTWRSQWMYDGRKTYEWGYDTKTGRLFELSIMPGPPRHVMLLKNSLAYTLGVQGTLRTEAVMSYLHEARRNRVLAGRHVENASHLDLGSFDKGSYDYDVTLTVDPENDYRLTSWRIERDEQVTAYGLTVPFVIEYAIDEWQRVTSESSGETIWFPATAHNESFGVIERIEIVSVRINHAVDDSHFEYRDPPRGTIVREFAADNRPPNEWLVGGGSVRDKRIAESSEKARMERVRLSREGVRFDATPRTGSTAIYWGICGGVILLVAGVCWMRQRV